jgi:hypothetical protein
MCINPEVKSWIDNVMVPILVREYLASEDKSGEPTNYEEPMVQCIGSNQSRKEGQ